MLITVVSVLRHCKMAMAVMMQMMIFSFIRFYISFDIQDLKNEYSFIVKKISYL